MQLQLEELRPSLRQETCSPFGICSMDLCSRVATTLEFVWPSTSGSTSSKSPRGTKIINRITLSKVAVEGKTIMELEEQLGEKIIQMVLDPADKMVKVRIIMEQPITTSTREESPPTNP